MPIVVGKNIQVMCILDVDDYSREIVKFWEFSGIFQSRPFMQNLVDKSVRSFPLVPRDRPKIVKNDEPFFSRLQHSCFASLRDSRSMNKLNTRKCIYIYIKLEHTCHSLTFINDVFFSSGQLLRLLEQDGRALFLEIYDPGASS